ncbi:MAG TPA: phosphate acyltransferase PlsX [Candidatus Sulfotelmatobacter sp.]|nr:phosphate acyltransferase PlsX [Candidatus Sulfotelmatobacter sp.]
MTATTLPLIAVDAMGGDNAPAEIVAGALLARRDGLARIALVGDRERIVPLLGGETDVEVVHAAGEIAMDAPPATAARASAGTSLGEAVELVRSGHASAAVSAGNSGAFLAVALIRLRTIPGIARPAIGAVLPGRRGPVVLCDAGANVDCKPEWLAQFGVMGAAYARAALGVAEPRVGIVSVGEEPGKGNAQTIEAAALLERAPVNFVGNVEGKDVLINIADVVVADGFVGNVILKTAEGSGTYFREVLRESYESASLLGRLGGLLSRGVFDAMRKRLDYSTYGGAPLLGLRGNCVVAHGRSDRIAIRNAIRQAAAVSAADLVGSIGAVLAA